MTKNSKRVRKKDRPIDPVVDKDLIEALSGPVKNPELWIKDSTEESMSRIENMDPDEWQAIVSAVFHNPRES